LEDKDCDMARRLLLFPPGDHAGALSI